MKSSIEAWSQRNWLKIDEGTRKRCVDHLRRLLPEDLVLKWKVNHDSGHRLDEGMERFHFGLGRQIRNILRDIIEDKDLPTVVYGDRTESRNWDDYYLAVLIDLVEELP